MKIGTSNVRFTPSFQRLRHFSPEWLFFFFFDIFPRSILHGRQENFRLQCPLFIMPQHNGTRVLLFPCFLASFAQDQETSPTWSLLCLCSCVFQTKKKKKTKRRHKRYTFYHFSDGIA